MTTATQEALRAAREGFDAATLAQILGEVGVDPVTEISPGLHGPSIAVYGSAGTYRYLLTRRWGPGALMTWVMLNPSTATAHEDDPTIARVTHRAKVAKYGGLAVLNLFALRATDPAELRTHPDPVGPSNNACISAWCQPGDCVVAAWGSHGRFLGRDRVVAGIFERVGVSLLCLGLTVNGQPRHPGRVAYALELIPFNGGTA